MQSTTPNPLRKHTEGQETTLRRNPCLDKAVPIRGNQKGRSEKRRSDGFLCLDKAVLAQRRGGHAPAKHSHAPASATASDNQWYNSLCTYCTTRVPKCTTDVSRRKMGVRQSRSHLCWCASSTRVGTANLQNVKHPTFAWHQFVEVGVRPPVPTSPISHARSTSRTRTVRRGLWC